MTDDAAEVELLERIEAAFATPRPDVITIGRVRLTPTAIVWPEGGPSEAEYRAVGAFLFGHPVARRPRRRP